VRRFFDTNILVYSQDRFEVAKRALARALIEEAIADDAFVISTQVVLEFQATVVRRNLLSAESALSLLRVWSEHQVVGSSAEFVLRSLELRERHELSIWDALIVQAAMEADCDVLLTEDLQHGMRFGEMAVANPFLEPPQVRDRISASRKPARTRRGVARS
jgi:predicted nucleic acid-binding protein